MEYLMAFVVMALTAIAFENPAFARALGLNKSTLLLNSRTSVIIYGTTMTWMLFVSSFPVTLCNYLLQDVTFTRWIRTPLFLICVLLVYIATYYVTGLFFPKIYSTISRALPISTFNTALFGAFYISARERFSFFQTTGYALGTGIGYTVALLIIYYARKRLAISPVPKSFQGLPILLVYIGLLSLAIYGLIGHGLPV